jgi:hypothetical protein
VLRTMFDPRNNLANEVSAQLIAHFADKVFRTVIPRNIRLAEAPSFGKPVLFHDKESRGALAYLALAGEMIRRQELASMARPAATVPAPTAAEPAAAPEETPSEANGVHPAAAAPAEAPPDAPVTEASAIPEDRPPEATAGEGVAAAETPPDTNTAEAAAVQLLPVGMPGDTTPPHEEDSGFNGVGGNATGADLAEGSSIREDIPR